MNFRYQDPAGSCFGRGVFGPVPMLIFVAVLSIVATRAGEEDGVAAPAAVDPIEESTTLDDLWDRTVLIQNDPGDPLGSLAFTGRLHYDYVHLDADAGDEELWAFRRARTGLRARFYGQWELNGEVEWDLNDADPLYSSLTNVYLAWRPSSEWTFKAGKQGAFFTMEGSTSSNELLTLERSNIANNFWFPSLFIPGITAEYREEDYRFTAGLFSGGSTSPEFGNFDGSVFGLFTAGRDFADELDATEAVLALHWVVEDPDPNNTFTRPHEQVASLNFRYEKDRWGWRGDLTRSLGSFDQADLTGLVLIPYLNLNEQWQVAARVTFIESEGADGIRLARYENRLSSERGDSYEDFYLGVNRYFKGHQLKWQAGVSHTRLRDSFGEAGYEGWGCSSGIRISW